MSKLVIGTENGFLDEIPAVSLDAQFGSTISQAINVINNNFKKLISVPFLRGEQGENVNAESLKIQDGGELTPLGKKIVESIYNISDCESFSDTLDNAFGKGLEIYGTNSWNSIKDNPDNQEIVFYKRKITDNNGEKLELVSQQIYIFLDNRIKNLETVWRSVQNGSNYDLTTFVDLSCALTITGTVDINPEDGTIDEDSYDFDIVKHNIIPTLYYDDDVKEWCWKINGMTTKISAQGLKGEDGINARSVVCFGEVDSVNGNSYKVAIQEVLSPGNTQITDLNIGDLAVVWYLVNGNLNCAFGSIEDYSGVPCIYVGQCPLNANEYLNADLMTILNNVSLRDKMNDICNTESTPSATVPSAYSPRGLWVPDKYKETVIDDETIAGSPDKVHMLWSENTNNGKAHIGLVNYSDTAGNATPPQEHTNTPDGNSLDIHYDILNKDFITLGRKMNCPSYAYKTSDIEVNESGDGTDSPNIVTNTISKSSEEITQYINVKESDTSVKMNSLNSKGLYIIGDSSTGDTKNQTALFSKTDHKLINSHSIITNTPINITGSNTNSYFICPLTDVENALKFKASQKIHINNEDVLISKGSVVIGENKVLSNAFNAYIQFKGNASIYNYDYFDVIKTYNGGFNAIYASPYRPRKINYVPVSIGGWLSMYNSKTRNSTGSFIVNKSETIELTPEQNFKHAFLSGKFGWTGVIENNGLTSDNVSQMQYQNFNKVSGFSQYLLDDGEDSSSVRYGVTTSMSGFWTKIGNVVDVKGKIMFCGTKFKFEKDANNNKGSLTVTKTYPLSYSALFDFITNNGNNIKFPLPIVLKRSSNDFYISTGNVFDNHSSLLNSITINSITDAHTDQQTKNQIISSGTSFNNILNGDAKIHFFGTGTVPTSRDFNNEGTVSLNSGSLQVAETVESLPNIFSCNANLKVIGDKNWGFLAIPKYENIDSGRDSSTSGKYENYAGPIRFSDAKPAKFNTRSDTHMYNIVRPELLYWTQHDDNPNSTPDADSINITNYKKLFLTTTIAPYIVRYMTFQFSYSLDDDIYGATTSKLINGLNGTNNLSKEGNYDSESYGDNMIEHAIDYENTSEFQIPAMNNGEYISTPGGLVNTNNGTIIGNNSITDYLNIGSTSQNSNNQGEYINPGTVTNSLNKTIYWCAYPVGNNISFEIGENQINTNNPDWEGTENITVNNNYDTVYYVIVSQWNGINNDNPILTNIQDVKLFNTQSEAQEYCDTHSQYSNSIGYYLDEFNLGNQNSLKNIQKSYLLPENY